MGCWSIYEDRPEDFLHWKGDFDGAGRPGCRARNKEEALEKVARRDDFRYVGSMAKQPPSKRASSDGKVVAIKAIGSRRNVTTRLGNVTVSGQRPSADVVRSNVAASTAALARVGAKLIKPGVHLPPKKGVPRYSADENNPGVFIQRLDGKITTGKLQNGQFVEAE